MSSNEQLSKNFNGDKINKSIFSSNQEQFKMSIDPNSTQHIIERLTDLYSDPIVATVREIMSNAIDATYEIPENKRKPIDIHIPSMLSSYFVVTDHALGLSLNQIKNIYTRYGMSTKRTDFSQIGAYGLGSKAPLSYSSSFNVSSVKDGYLTEILISIEDGTNNVKILNHEKSNEENYMKVSIPVDHSDIDDFKMALNTYAEHKIPGIQLNGLDELDKSSDNDMLIQTLNYKGLTLNLYKHEDNNDNFNMSTIRDIITQDKDDYDIKGLLAGFTYDLQQSSSYFIHSQYYLIELKPGLVDFSSSRDEITNTSRKREFVGFLNDEIEKNKKTILLNILNKLSSDYSKLSLYQSLYKHDLLDKLQNIIKYDNMKSVFTLSSNKYIGDINIHPIGIIDESIEIPSYPTNTSIPRYGNAIVKNLNVNIARYFKPELVKQDDYLSNKYNNLSNDEIAKTLLFDFLQINFNLKNIIITDITTAYQAKKVLSYRNALSKANKMNELVLFNNNFDEVQQVYNDYILNDDNRDNHLIMKYQDFINYSKSIKNSMRNTTAKQSEPHVLNTYEFYANNVNDLFNIMNKNTNPNNFHQLQNNKDDNKSIINVGLITDYDFNSSDVNIQEYITYMNILKDDNTQIKFTVYDGCDLLYSDIDTLKTNDYFMLIHMRNNTIKSKKLKEFINKSQLPKYTGTIDFTNTNINSDLKHSIIKKIITEQEIVSQDPNNNDKLNISFDDFIDDLYSLNDYNDDDNNDLWLEFDPNADIQVKDKDIILPLNKIEQLYKDVNEFYNNYDISHYYNRSALTYYFAYKYLHNMTNK